MAKRLIAQSLIELSKPLQPLYNKGLSDSEENHGARKDMLSGLLRIYTVGRFCS